MLHPESRTGIVISLHVQATGKDAPQLKIKEPVSLQATGRVLSIQASDEGYHLDIDVRSLSINPDPRGFEAEIALVKSAPPREAGRNNG